MKKLLLLLFLLPFITIAQEYVDLFKIEYGNTFNSTFKNTNSNTDIKSFKADLTLPLVLNENNAIITGIDFRFNSLQLFPETSYTSLYSTTLKLGVSSTLSNIWSTTIVLLPKIASNYKQISSDDFYLGGLALLKFKKNENLKYKIGVYASSEAFGIFTTPVIGAYYLSSNKRFEIDASLPISADLNYSFGKISLGFNYFANARSFNIKEENLPSLYVEQSPIEFSSYIQFSIVDNILLKAKVGYTSNNYEAYSKNDDVDFRISAFSFGDDRVQLNPELSGGMFLKFEVVYRFHIHNNQGKKQLEN